MLHKSICSLMRISKYLGLLYTGAETYPRMKEVHEQGVAVQRWEAEKAQPPERAGEANEKGEHAKACLTARAVEVSPKDARTLDYMSGQPVNSPAMLQQPEAEPSARKQPWSEDEVFFDQLQLAEASLADDHPSGAGFHRYESRYVPSAEDQPMTFV